MPRELRKYLRMASIRRPARQLRVLLSVLLFSPANPAIVASCRRENAIVIEQRLRGGGEVEDRDAALTLLSDIRGQQKICPFIQAGAQDLGGALALSISSDAPDLDVGAQKNSCSACQQDAAGNPLKYGLCIDSYGAGWKALLCRQCGSQFKNSRERSSNPAAARLNKCAAAVQEAQGKSY